MKDYFQSAFYFDGGAYHLPGAGLTHLSFPNSTVHLSAYKLHAQGDFVCMVNDQCVLIVY